MPESPKQTISSSVSRQAKPDSLPEHNFHRPWTKSTTFTDLEPKEWQNSRINVKPSVEILRLDLSQNFAEKMNWIAPNLNSFKTRTRDGLLGNETATDQTKPFNIEVPQRKFQRQPQKENSTIRSINDQPKSPKSNYTSQAALIPTSVSTLNPKDDRAESNVLSSIKIQDRSFADGWMNWNATSSDIQDAIPRYWLPRNWNNNKSNRAIQLWILSKGQIMQKQQESVKKSYPNSYSTLLPVR